MRSFCGLFLLREQAREGKGDAKCRGLYEITMLYYARMILQCITEEEDGEEGVKSLLSVRLLGLYGMG